MPMTTSGESNSVLRIHQHLNFNNIDIETPGATVAATTFQTGGPPERAGSQPD